MGWTGCSPSSAAAFASPLSWGKFISLSGACSSESVVFCSPISHLPPGCFLWHPRSPPSCSAWLSSSPSLSSSSSATVRSELHRELMLHFFPRLPPPTSTWLLDPKTEPGPEEPSLFICPLGWNSVPKGLGGALTLDF